MARRRRMHGKLRRKSPLAKAEVSPLKAEGSKAVTQLELDRSFKRKRKAKWYATGEGRNEGVDFEDQNEELSNLASTGQYIPPDSAI